MRYGVIGCGYVGTAVAIRMQHTGAQVIATTRSTEKVRELQPISLAVLVEDHVGCVRPRVHEWSPERSLESVGVAGPSPVNKQASKQARHCQWASVDL